jgi:Mce-associated membrane protein
VAAAFGVALAAVLVAAAVLLTSGSLGGTARGSSEGELRRSALEAARAATVSITSYDHRRLDEDFGRVRALAVGEFAKEYEESTAALRPALEQSSAVATAEVPGLGVEELSTEPVRAVVVVLVDQTISTAGAEPRTELNRLRMTLVRPDRTWLVEKVQRL